jgi:hypothetical protein
MKKVASIAESQPKGFIDKFKPAYRSLIRDVRKKVRMRFPSAHELVYLNYNFFVVGYSATERPSDAFISMAASAKGVGMCFTHGASFPDPKGILLGSGKQTRFIHLETAAMIEGPEVDALLFLAAARSKAPLAPQGAGSLVIRSVSAKQRPRQRSWTRMPLTNQRVWRSRRDISTLGGVRANH